MIICQAGAKGNVYNSLFDLLSIYPLDRDPEYHYSTPLFDTLVDRSSSVEDIMVHPVLTDADTETDSLHCVSDIATSNRPSSTDSGDYLFPKNLPIAESAGDEEHDAILTSAEGDAALLGPLLPIQGPSSKPFWVTLKKNKSIPKSMSKKEKVCCAEFEKKSQQA